MKLCIKLPQKDTEPITTRNLRTVVYAVREIPLPDVVYDFLMARKQYIVEQLQLSNEEIPNLPIACLGQNFMQMLRVSQFKDAGKAVLSKAKVDTHRVACMEAEMNALDIRYYTTAQLLGSTIWDAT